MIINNCKQNNEATRYEPGLCRPSLPLNEACAFAADFLWSTTVFPREDVAGRPCGPLWLLGILLFVPEDWLVLLKHSAGQLVWFVRLLQTKHWICIKNRQMRQSQNALHRADLRVWCSFVGGVSGVVSRSVIRLQASRALCSWCSWRTSLNTHG